MEVENMDIDLSSIKNEQNETQILMETQVKGESDNKSYPEKYFEIYRSYSDKNYKQCLSYIEQVTEEHMEYKILQSACLIHLGTRIDEAHKILDEILENNPTNAYTIYAKGLAFYFEQQWEESIEHFERARELDKSSDMDRAEFMMEKAKKKLNSELEEVEEELHDEVATSKSPRRGRKVRRFGCEICNHFFAKKYNLDRHNRSLHKRATPNDFPTSPQPRGGVVVKTEKIVETSSVIETFNIVDVAPTIKKELKSPKAARKIFIKSGLNRGGKIKCPTCKKLFRKTSYARHAIIHSGNKPHKCEQCPMAFFQKSDLARHEVIYKKKIFFKMKEKLIFSLLQLLGNTQRRAELRVRPLRAQIQNQEEPAGQQATSPFQPITSVPFDFLHNQMQVKPCGRYFHHFKRNKSR